GRSPDAALLPRALSAAPQLLPAAALLALMGCIQIALPYVLLSYGLKRVPGAEAGLLALVEPLLTPVWVALVIGERPTAATLAGGVSVPASASSSWPSRAAGSETAVGRSAGWPGNRMILHASPAWSWRSA